MDTLWNEISCLNANCRALGSSPKQASGRCLSDFHRQFGGVTPFILEWATVSFEAVGLPLKDGVTSASETLWRQPQL